MTTLSEASDDSLICDGAKCYRPRCYFLYVGIVCTLFFLVMGVGSTCVAYWNVDGSFTRPKLAALLFAVFWSAFTLLGIWLLLFYARSRLVISTTCVESTGLFKMTTLAFNDVTRVKWRRFPRYGSIVLRTPDRKLIIDLGDFLESQRAELIELTRRMIDREHQDGWPRFSERFVGKQETGHH